MTTERERIYDAEIAPRIAAILRVCQEHGIPMIASFDVGGPGDEDLLINSAVLGSDDREDMIEAAYALGMIEVEEDVDA